MLRRINAQAHEPSSIAELLDHNEILRIRQIAKATLPRIEPQHRLTPLGSPALLDQGLRLEDIAEALAAIETRKKTGANPQTIGEFAIFAPTPTSYGLKQIASNRSHAT